MTEVGFYHLTATPLERALPKLLERVIEAGKRAVVIGGSEARIDSLDTALWVYHPQSFLAHGTPSGGHADEQPIYLTTAEENPNGAQILVLVDGIEPGFIDRFERCLDLFDGKDGEALEAARRRWRERKEAGHSVTYWRQAEDGRWEKKA